MDQVLFRDVLREKNFSRLWTGQVISSLGDRFYVFAILAVVLGVKDTTNPGQQFALVSFCGVMPGMLFAPVYGWVVDRFSRQLVMIWADLIRSFITLTLIYIWSFEHSLIGVYAVVFVMGMFNGLFIPARQAALPQLISAEKLVAANALISSIGIIANMLGVPLAQLFVTIFDPSYCFVINSIGFLVSALCVVRITADLSPNTAERMAGERKEGLWQNAMKGVQVLQNQPELVPLLIAISVFSIGGGLGLPAIVQHVSRSLDEAELQSVVAWMESMAHPYFPHLQIHETALTFGAVFAAIGLGMGVGVGLCGWLGRLSRWEVFPLAALIVQGFALYNFALTHEFAVAILGAVFIGLPTAFLINTVEARLQNDVVNENRGRLFALKNLCTASGFILGLGANLDGRILSHFGTALVFEWLGGVMVVDGVVLLVMNRHRLTSFWEPKGAVL